MKLLKQWLRDPVPQPSYRNPSISLFLNVTAPHSQWTGQMHLPTPVFFPCLSQAHSCFIVQHIAFFPSPRPLCITVPCPHNPKEIKLGPLNWLVLTNVGHSILSPESPMETIVPCGTLWGPRAECFWLILMKSCLAISFYFTSVLIGWQVNNNENMNLSFV